MIFSRTAVALASDDDGRPYSMVFVDCDVSFGAGDGEIGFNTLKHKCEEKSDEGNTGEI